MTVSRPEPASLAVAVSAHAAESDRGTDTSSGVRPAKSSASLSTTEPVHVLAQDPEIRCLGAERTRTTSAWPRSAFAWTATEARTPRAEELAATTADEPPHAQTHASSAAAAGCGQVTRLKT